MWIINLLFGVLVITGVAICQPCNENEFQCLNGQCIPEELVCHVNDDCEEWSDEMHWCYGCNENQWRCPSGKCIMSHWICDGEDDCGDNSDEVDPETGECPLCPETQFQCGSGECPSKKNVCDGICHCRDGSDEPENRDECPVCKDDQLRCPIGRCIEQDDLCDDYNDCGDWSDERDETCPCEDNGMRCPTPPDTQPGKCISEKLICDADGIWDCPDGADEANCTGKLEIANNTKDSTP